MSNYFKVKNRLFLAFLLLNFGATFALANINRAVHIPQNGDCIDKLQCEMLNVGSGGECALWDFSDAVLLDESHRVKYFVMGDTLLIRCEGESMSTFLLKGDSVLWKGHENRLSFMKDSIAPLQMLLPMEYGDSITTPLNMRGNYCGNNALVMIGQRTVHIDGRGTLVLLGDTVENVERMHVKTTGKVKISTDTKGLSPHTGIDSLLNKVEDIYLWYSDSHRFPLAEVRITAVSSANGHATIKATSCICPPSVQEYALGRGFTNTELPSLASKNHGESGEGSNELHPAIKDLTLSVGAGYVDVTFTSSVYDKVSMVLTDIFGRVFSSLPSRNAEMGVTYSDRIDTSRLQSGTYVLHVSVANDIQNRKFTIK